MYILPVRPRSTHQLRDFGKCSGEQGWAAERGPQKGNSKKEQPGQLQWYWAAGARRVESDHNSEKLTPISEPLWTLVSPFPSHFTVPLELTAKATSLTISFWDLHKQRAHCESQVLMVTSLVKLPGFRGNFHYLSRTCYKFLILTLGTHLWPHVFLCSTLGSQDPIRSGPRKESGQNAQSNSPNIMGKFKSSQGKVTPSPSALWEAVHSTFMWSSINDHRDRAAFRQGGFKNGNNWVSGKEGEILVGGTEKLTEYIKDQTNWWALCTAWDQTPAQLKNGTNPDVQAQSTPQHAMTASYLWYVGCKFTGTFEAQDENVSDYLKWEAPSSTKCSTGNFLYGEVHTKKC